MNKLYVVATPIGNLEDITLRALRVLREVDVILCEDTRETLKLLRRYEIEPKRLESLNARSENTKSEKVIRLLDEGNSMVLVSDAGTPTISDPGSLLISRLQEHFRGEFSIIPIPGANAAIAALSVCGFPASDFLFLGFLPHKKGRETLFNEITASKRTVVFYESPHRIMATLRRLTKLLEPPRRVCVAREVTKLFEDIFVGTAQEALEHLRSERNRQKGEFTLVVEGT